MHPARRSSRSRRASIVAGLATAAFVVVPSAAHAANVAVFDNGDYVDTGDVLDDGDHEALNVRMTYESYGDTVTRFTAITGAGIRTALAGKDVLALPEQEIEPLIPALDADAQAAIREFVAGGGRLVVFDDYLYEDSFLNGLFGWSLKKERFQFTWNLAPQAADSPFAGGAESLEYQDDTEPAMASTLPSGAVPVYRSEDGASVAVFTVPYGVGTVVFMGYDWYDSAPPNPEGQDGGWIGVLRRASAVPAPAPVVPPAPPAPAPPAPPVVVPPVPPVLPLPPADTTAPVVSSLTATRRQVRWRVSEAAKMQVLVSRRTTVRRAGRTVVVYRRVRTLQVSKRLPGIASIRLESGLGRGRFRVAVTSRDDARNAGRTVRAYRTW